MQVNHRAEWLELLQQAFAGLDADGDGVVRLPELLRLLADKLPEHEVNAALQVGGAAGAARLGLRAGAGLGAMG